MSRGDVWVWEDGTVALELADNLGVYWLPDGSLYPAGDVPPLPKRSVQFRLEEAVGCVRVLRTVLSDPKGCFNYGVCTASPSLSSPPPSSGAAPTPNSNPSSTP